MLKIKNKRASELCKSPSNLSSSRKPNKASKLVKNEELLFFSKKACLKKEKVVAEKS